MAVEQCGLAALLRIANDFEGPLRPKLPILLALCATCQFLLSRQIRQDA